MNLKLLPSLGFRFFPAAQNKPSLNLGEKKPLSPPLTAASIEPAHGVRNFFRVHSRSAASYAAFLLMVLASVLAAAAVAGNDMPLVFGGL